MEESLEGKCPEPWLKSSHTEEDHPRNLPTCLDPKKMTVFGSYTFCLSKLHFPTYPYLQNTTINMFLEKKNKTKETHHFQDVQKWQLWKLEKGPHCCEPWRGSGKSSDWGLLLCCWPEQGQRAPLNWMVHQDFLQLHYRTGSSRGYALLTEAEKNMDNHFNMGFPLNKSLLDYFLIFSLLWLPYPHTHTEQIKTV